MMALIGARFRKILCFLLHSNSALKVHVCRTLGTFIYVFIYYESPFLSILGFA